jgi:hypothetical protein
MGRLLAVLFALAVSALSVHAQAPVIAPDPECELSLWVPEPVADRGEPEDEATHKIDHPHAVSYLAPPEPYESRPKRFEWGPAVRQSMTFLAVQHTFRMTELKTRRELGGPFFKDWFESVRSLHGWDDGGRQFTNYVAHPMQGALYGYIQVQNDPNGINRTFDGSGAYWRSRMKAMGWAAIWSTQFELGPLSQASIGNVGAGVYEAKKMAYVDLVVTPTLGTTWIVAEDAIDRYVLGWIERRTENRLVRSLARMALNPMRSCANVLRFKPMWYRDTRR